MEIIKTLEDLVKVMYQRPPFNTYFKIEDRFLCDVVEVCSTEMLIILCEYSLHLTTYQFNLIYNELENDDNDPMQDFTDRTLSMQIEHYNADQLRTAMEYVGSTDVTSFIESFDEDIFTELVDELDWEEITSNKLMDLEIPAKFFIENSQTIFRNNICNLDSLGEYYGTNDDVELLARLVR